MGADWTVEGRQLYSESSFDTNQLTVHRTVADNDSNGLGWLLIGLLLGAFQ